MDKSEISLYQVDAFTDKPFQGNPAAVCLLKHQYSDEILQQIAAEMNLSETAFLCNSTNDELKEAQRFSLRWFTPKTEVPLCGHATLASATVLFYDIDVSASTIAFETKSGRLTASLEGDWISLNFPSYATTPYNPDNKFLRATGITNFTTAHLSRKAMKLLIHLPNEGTIWDLRPNFEQMKSVQPASVFQGVIVTSIGHQPYDFVSRFFAPWIGINEDPVTGSAHTVLGPYWSKRLGKEEMFAFQASSRGGELKVRIRSNDRVDLLGKAVIISKGKLYL